MVGDVHAAWLQWNFCSGRSTKTHEVDVSTSFHHVPNKLKIDFAVSLYVCVCLCVSQGHVDEMWGLATHPSQNIFLTCGHDRQVCLWNTEEHKLDWCITLEVGHAASLVHWNDLLFRYPSADGTYIWIKYTDVRSGADAHAANWSCVSPTGVRVVCWFLPEWISGFSRPQHRKVI